MSAVQPPYAAEVGRPAQASKTRRDDATANAKRELSAYRSLLNPGRYALEAGAIPAAEPDPQRSMRLLRAIAALERALYLETGGRFGDPQATSRTVLDRSRR